jgi:hypothetical protein
LNKTDSGRRIYGGVDLQLKLTEDRVPRNDTVLGYNATNIFASQTNGSAAGPRNKEEYHKMKENLVVASAGNGEKKISISSFSLETFFPFLKRSSKDVSGRSRGADSGDMSCGGGSSEDDGENECGRNGNNVLNSKTCIGDQNVSGNN